MNKIFKISALLFLMSVFGMGCAGTMYIPQSLESEDKVALSLIAYYDEVGKSKFFIDGELAYDHDLAVSRWHCGKHIYVLPGKHKIRNINKGTFALYDDEFVIDTEAGYKYNVKTNRPSGYLKVKLNCNKKKVKK
jgi:hypothetical protein